MPRKSPQELALVPNIDERRRRIETPRGMSPAESRLFSKIVSDCHPLHFHQGDALLLRSFVQACLLAELAFENAMESPEAIKDWQACTKTVASLALRLRLAPSARTDPRTLLRSILNRPDLSEQEMAAVRGWKSRG
jgi:hypothetical protein